MATLGRVRGRGPLARRDSGRGREAEVLEVHIYSKKT